MQHEQWRYFVREHQPQKVIAGKAQLEQMLSSEDNTCLDAANASESQRGYLDPARIRRAASRALREGLYSDGFVHNNLLHAGNFVQANEAYSEMAEYEKGLDRMVVSAVTIRLLEMMENGNRPG